jgi:excisionase family DNA binding protein
MGAAIVMIRKVKSEASTYASTDTIVASPIAVRVPQAVAMLGLSRSKLYEYIQSGEIEIVKIGRATLLPVDSLRRFLEKYRNIQNPDA